MQDNTFSEKLYTSTEVAEILGVSLRSIYRYLDENKIQAAVRTATGRHRFTRQNINDFLHPNPDQQKRAIQQAETVSEEPEQEIKQHDVVNSENVVPEVKKAAKHVEQEPKKEDIKPIEEEAVKDEPVDWLARFRQAAEKYKTQETTLTREPIREQPAKVKEPEKDLEELEESSYSYYRSGVGGLKEIAQSIDKSAKNASIDYAFTMNAGLSLHKPIKPFSLIHSYIRSADLPYFEKVMQLTPCQKDTAQLCLITSNDDKVYDKRKELHGLYVVSDSQIKEDLLNEGETELANELE